MLLQLFKPGLPVCRFTLQLPFQLFHQCKNGTIRERKSSLNYVEDPPHPCPGHLARHQFCKLLEFLPIQMKPHQLVIKLLYHIGVITLQKCKD